jgi:tetratricopeptide (TPR) repeat protein
VHLLAQFLQQSERIEEARDLLTRAAQWHPAYAPVYQQLISIFERQSNWAQAIALTEDWERHCPRDPRARLRRGLFLICAGRVQEGTDLLLDAMRQFPDPMQPWYPPYAAEAPTVLRRADPLASNYPGWSDVILKAADLFPQGLWLPARAGAICFERGEYARGASLLQQAHERLQALEWQKTEGMDAPPELRRTVDFYRMACQELAEH